MKQFFDKRGIEMLADAADCFEQGGSPFNDDFVNSHDISFEDMMVFSNRIAIILRGFARADVNIQGAILLMGASNQISPERVETAMMSRRMDDLIAKLGPNFPLVP